MPSPSHPVLKKIERNVKETRASACEDVREDVAEESIFGECLVRRLLGLTRAGHGAEIVFQFTDDVAQGTTEPFVGGPIEMPPISRKRLA